MSRKPPRILRPFLPLTPRQIQIRDAINELHKQEGRPPGVRVIADRLGMSGHSYVDRVRVKLRKRGEVS